MIPRRASLLCAASLLISAATAADAPNPIAAKSAIETGPALGWVFPVFSDKEGYRLFTLRGASAQVLGPDRVDVTGFSAVVFSGDATERVDTVLLSPAATFSPKTNRASGDSSVRLIHDDIEVTGVGWTYDHAAKKVSIAHQVRVTFQGQINDILK
jgi:opacity protein-like surface antigen